MFAVSDERFFTQGLGLGVALIRKVGTLIRKHTSAPMVVLIGKLNQVLRGWANYHRHVVASERLENHL